ncbi:hypothetical protein J2Z21_004643 [Streptomyces griseochromogenes]|uniref:DUF397 domain-containing protein n=1 Tax=Streptomyces griseochromogenes TaxID=68214 RepID=A0A1B1ATH0_9ACTN|nr:DUF397 domain-containing protein [Streptomyces griseochromogenes]ANP49841.1 hypothetical protein AVL59_09650 [Streptomyces griseochromogenes]MBP2051666.1 hypothetical protein [Streptomyces griseochromogenes]
MNPSWQKSSYCSEGNACIYIAATPGTIHLTESTDPTGAVLTTTPAAFRSLLTALKQEPAPANRSDEGDAPFRLRSADIMVTTTRHKWNAFVLGVRAGEFDHFVEDIDGEYDSGTRTSPGSQRLCHRPTNDGYIASVL